MMVARRGSARPHSTEYDRSPRVAAESATHTHAGDKNADSIVHRTSEVAHVPNCLRRASEYASALPEQKSTLAPGSGVAR
jgi:hypothetical protein